MEIVGGSRTIGTVTGCPSREEAVRRAEELADDWINRQACDLAELVVVIEVGGEDVRRFEGGQWEDVE